jgi:hypothetical protein
MTKAFPAIYTKDGSVFIEFEMDDATAMVVELEPHTARAIGEVLLRASAILIQKSSEATTS